MSKTLCLDISLTSALEAISRVGDLSMGQPLGHSRRVANLAQRLAKAGGGNQEHLQVAQQIALLRWSGCTANAEGFSHLLGDDVQGRRAMLDQTLQSDHMNAIHQAVPLAVVHCEVAGEIARTLGLGKTVESGLCRVFETYDGAGRPLGVTHEQIPEVAYQVVLAGDLDILSRAHGLDAALGWITDQSDRRYPASLAAQLVHNARDWLAEVDNIPLTVDEDNAGNCVSLTLVGDVIDLKLPWLSGYSRQVAQIAAEAAYLWGMPQPAIDEIGKAALIHGLGRAGIPNHIWNANGSLAYGATERTHLVPYWTQKAAQHISELAVPGDVAAHAYEKLDGSGYYRGLNAESLRPQHQLLAATVAWVALRAHRPWRKAFSESEAAAILRQEVTNGSRDQNICDAVMSAARGDYAGFHKPRQDLLTTRECQVLHHISQGASNKTVARALNISPSTVRTHMESIFRKLECSTRAAATLKALTLGLIS